MLESLAKKIASKSEHHQHHHAVIITKGGAIVAMATNKRHIHAEENALSQLYPHSLQRALVTGELKNFDGGKYTLYSFRFRKDLQMGMAAPCSNCAFMIGLLGIKKVYYTNEEGKLVRL